MKRPEAVDQVEPTVATESVDDAEAAGTIRSALSRRLFLTRSSLTVVAAGVATAMPSIPLAVNAAEADGPEAESAISEGDALSGPLVAHVKDLQTGEVSIYSGEREFSIVDRGLAAKLFNAAR
jgi:hypothetical protein